MPNVRATVAPNPRILLVEDDPALRSTLAEVLEERGYHVDCAANGLMALEALGHKPVPSAILLDLAMPVMDGWEFRAEQQRDPRLADIPTIVLSASLGADGRRFEGPAPAAALAKPFDLHRLLDALQRACEPDEDVVPARAGGSAASVATAVASACASPKALH
jgi:CheY-like chemotaxis protein